MPVPAPRRVLYDESVPHDLVAAVTEQAAGQEAAYEAATVQGLGWAGMKNGALLRAARSAGWEVLVTVDRRMEFQQNIPASGVALVVLRAPSTRVPDLLPLVPALLAALPGVRAGTVTHVRAA